MMMTISSIGTGTLSLNLYRLFTNLCTITITRKQTMEAVREGGKVCYRQAFAQINQQVHQTEWPNSRFDLDTKQMLKLVDINVK